jgi:hypothetical protein
LKDNKDKSDSVSNHSLQGSKLNHSFQKLAMSLKKKSKQKKNSLLDTNQYDSDDDDEDNDEIDFSQSYTQIDDDDDSNDNNNTKGFISSLSPPPKSEHSRYPLDLHSNSIKFHQKSKSMGRFPDSHDHKSSNNDNIGDLSHSYDYKSKPPTIASQSSINPSSFAMSPLNKTAPLNTQPKSTKKVPPPIPPKPKELKNYVIPNSYPGVPARQSSISTKTIIDDKHNLNHNDRDDPLKVSSTKLSGLSNLKVSPISQNTTSLSSTNLTDNRRHSGYYFDNEEAFQQLNDPFANNTDEMENFPDDNDSDQDIFNNGKTKRRSKFKYHH